MTTDYAAKRKAALEAIVEDAKARGADGFTAAAQYLEAQIDAAFTRGVDWARRAGRGRVQR